jgi:hypothetical protein
MDEPLTRMRAAQLVREQIQRSIDPSLSYRGWNQYRWLLEQLAGLCVAQSIANKETEDQFTSRLDAASDILYNVWYLAASEIATRFWRENESPTLDEQKTIAKAKATIWTRHDPKIAFEKGYTSEHHVAFNRDDLHAFVADYLARPWLRHHVLDWILVDIMISRELSAFGEELKQLLLPGRRSDSFFGVHWRYYETKGDLRRMTGIDWAGISSKIVILMAFPLGAIYAAFFFGYNSLGAGLSSLYGLAVLGWIASKVFSIIVKVGYGLAGKVHPRAKPFVLWEKMYEVWTLLEGPIINPTLLREAMIKTRDYGARWDQAAWAIVERVIAYDPAVWIVRPTS